MQIDWVLTTIGRALGPSRIARSISAVLVLTLIQTIALPIIDVAIPKASASSLYDNRTNFLQWNSWRTGANHVPWYNESTSEIVDNNSGIQFTQNQNSQSGFLWNTQTLSFSNDFTASANFYFGAANSDGGADGILFSMRPLGDWPNDGISGSSSGGTPFWSTGEIRAWFDTYQNEGELANDHLTVSAVTTAGAVTTYTRTGSDVGTALYNSSGSALTNVEDNNFYPFTIKWTANTRTLTIYAGLSANYQFFSQVIPVNEMDATSFNWGFAAFTGGLNNYQMVAAVNYHVGPTSVSSTATDTSVDDGTSVSWTASYAATEGTPTTRWEYSTDGGSTWTSTGVTSSTYTFTATRALTQRKYRFYISSTGLGSTFSRATTPVLLTVNPINNETDTALSLNGSSQFAWAPDDNSLDIDNEFTFEAWVKPTSINSGVWNIVFGKYGSFQIGISTTGKWAYAFAGAVDPSGASTSVLAAVNEWHHLAFTRSANSNNLNFYYDGTLVATYSGSTVPTGALTNSTGIFSVGALRASSSSSEKWFAGSIDHVAIFTAIRNESTIKLDMNNYLSKSDSTLKINYDFNETSGSKIYNRVNASVSASDLEIVGASYVDVKEVDTTTLPAYTIIKFPRSYINFFGGWKVPSNIPKVSLLAVAGGGAGGSRVGGGGGAGGYVFRGSVQLTGGSIETITVGAGGRGVPNYAGINGGRTQFGTRLIAIGGGGGGTSNSYSGNRKGRDGGSGGGGGDSTNDATRGYGSSTQTSQGSVDGFGFAGGIGDGGAADWSAGGGGGASSSGYSGASGTTKRSFGGDGRLDPIGGSNLCLAAGGGGGVYGTVTGDTRSNGGTCSTGTATSGSGTSGLKVGFSAAANSGSGGGGAGYYYSAEGADVAGGNGGSGVIMIRWITASVPNYTKPVNAYLNAGMTETFTTNVSQDSSTVNLIRTFKWESTTPAANGVYSLIKQGTGAANAAFSWIPSDTSTSGAGYLYRLTVTDSDTAGLFITDSSTAYAVINRALSVSGTSGIAKTINIAKSETFTISLGTSTYRTTLTSNNPGISLDTSTATSPVVTISDTMSVGTYYETLTVTDSVSAVVITPLTIVVSAPPTLAYSSSQYDSNQIFNLDFSNSASFNPNTGVFTDISGTKKVITSPNGGNYSPDYSGIYTLNSGSSQYLAATGFTATPRWSIETYIRINSSVSAQFCPFASEYGPNTQIAMFLCFDTARTVFTGFFKQDGASAKWSFKRSNEVVPLNTWVHIVGTFDGSAVNLYFDGVSTTPNSSDGGRFDAGYTPPTPYSNKVFIGKDYTTAVGTTPNISLGYVHAYKEAISQSKVQQNYNATKVRFLSANIDRTYPSQKYGTRSSESFTATSGNGTKVVSYFNGTRPGLTWSTSDSITALTLSETLSATTYYDTITVTDSLGASTFLPIRMSITKADTLTISMDTATTVVYNTAPITIYPKPYFKGLAGVDSLTVSTRFSSPTYLDSATVPTDVDTYTVIAANPIFSVGALSNYVSVVYETSTARVTPANQNKLSINLYGAVAGTPFLIQTFGGSGDGAVTESVTAGSTATGCSVSNHVLSNTSPSTQQLTCNILVTKAASKNYKVETMTATVYFMLYVNNMPTNQVGSGSTIGLNGFNSVWVDPGATPTITGPGAGTYAANSAITITGSGFSLGPITVKFERNQLGTNISVSSDTSMSVTIPAGARSGVFSVTNQNGTEYSGFAITIG